MAANLGKIVSRTFSTTRAASSAVHGQAAVSGHSGKVSLTNFLVMYALKQNYLVTYTKGISVNITTLLTYNIIVESCNRS